MLELFVFDGKHTKKTERFRSVVRQDMQARYSGWRDDFDEQFDERSLYFYLSSDTNEFAITTRFTFRERNGISGPFCIELAEENPYYVTDDTRVWPNYCEGSCMTYREIEHMPIFMLAIGNYVKQHRIGPIYSSLDPRSPVVKMYNSFGGWNRLSAPPLKFHGLKYQADKDFAGEIVPWHVVQLQWQDSVERCERLGAAMNSENIPRFRAIK